MFAELGIPWKVLYQRGGKHNWVRAVGSSLVGVAILQAVLTWGFASKRETRITEVTEQWRVMDAVSETTTPGSIRVEIISGMRPEAFAKDYDQRISYRKMWSAAYAALGVLIFCFGGLIDVAIPEPLDE